MHHSTKLGAAAPTDRGCGSPLHLARHSPSLLLCLIARGEAVDERETQTRPLAERGNIAKGSESQSTCTSGQLKYCSYLRWRSRCGARSLGTLRRVATPYVATGNIIQRLPSTRRIGRPLNQRLRAPSDAPACWLPSESPIGGLTADAPWLVSSSRFRD